MNEPQNFSVLRVLVVDDQQVVREGLVALLGLLDDVEIVGSAQNGSQALDLVAEARPHVVLMDLRMPVMDGVEASRLIAQRHPDVAVVVLTTYADDESIAAALQAGARGYLTKHAGREEIAAALRSSVVGQSTLDQAVSRRLTEALRSQLDTHPAPRPDSRRVEASGPRPDRLTDRELQVLRLIRKGLANAEIAATLFIAETTVKTHINNAFAKIGARDRADAVRYAFEHDLDGD